MSEVFDDPADGHVNPDDLAAGDPADIPTPNDPPAGGVPLGSGTTPTTGEVAA